MTFADSSGTAMQPNRLPEAAVAALTSSASVGKQLESSQLQQIQAEDMGNNTKSKLYT